MLFGLDGGKSAFAVEAGKGEHVVGQVVKGQIGTRYGGRVDEGDIKPVPLDKGVEKRAGGPHAHDGELVADGLVEEGERPQHHHDALPFQQFANVKNLQNGGIDGNRSSRFFHAEIPGINLEEIRFDEALPPQEPRHDVTGCRIAHAEAIRLAKGEQDKRIEKAEPLKEHPRKLRAPRRRTEDFPEAERKATSPAQRVDLEAARKAPEERRPAVGPVSTLDREIESTTAKPAQQVEEEKELPGVGGDLITRARNRLEKTVDHAGKVHDIHRDMVQTVPL